MSRTAALETARGLYPDPEDFIDAVEQSRVANVEGFSNETVNVSGCTPDWDDIIDYVRDHCVDNCMSVYVAGRVKEFAAF